jgi:hypothetical protein
MGRCMHPARIGARKTAALQRQVQPKCGPLTRLWFVDPIPSVVRSPDLGVVYSPACDIMVFAEKGDRSRAGNERPRRTAGNAKSATEIKEHGWPPPPAA